ncbi:vacuolar membrane-associated protein iml1 [Malassezia psittaci]|uniref:Vacuolar membrane-associated protein IML1 n=1 Tax=Malassezia psittaci TaxID=1821823 RepID=A0AAF0JG38_9BASI|nr:vacuolar membrane-associated protein iml1 [Malassezia psittaci]
MPRSAGVAREKRPRGSQSQSLDRSKEGFGEHDLVNSRRISLWTHQPPNFSTHSLVLNPNYSLPQISDGELLMLVDQQEWDAMHNLSSRRRSSRKPRALVFTPRQALADTEVIAKQHQLQLSVARNIANLYGLASRSEAVLCRTSRAAHTIEHVELYFKDQYIGRSDMWRLSTSLIDQCVYVGQKIQIPAGMRATVGRLYCDNHYALSGYVGPSTKPVFRSESANYSLLLQMSQEMWEFDEGGEIYFEKFLQGFLPDLLAKWETIGTNHVVSVVLFTRVHYTKDEKNRLEGLPVQQVASTGQYYVDYYKVIIDLESKTHWPSVMRILKEEFFRFQHDILLQPRRSAVKHVAPPAPSDEATIDFAAIGGRRILGKLSHAYDGNLLEAINLALNPFDQHYIDRDLTRTGFELVVISAGTGHFHVDKQLLRTTTQRMSEIGLSVDLVCLAQMPLHTAPIFYFESAPPERLRSAATSMQWNRSSSGTPTSAKPVARSPSLLEAPLFIDLPNTTTSQTYYVMPYWINGSFYSQDPDRPYRADRFVPRCKMDAMRMLDLLGSGHQDVSIPYLGAIPDVQNASSASLRRAARDRFDAELFRPIAKQNSNTPFSNAFGTPIQPTPPAVATPKSFEPSWPPRAPTATSQRENPNAILPPSTRAALNQERDRSRSRSPVYRSRSRSRTPPPLDKGQSGRNASVVRVHELRMKRDPSTTRTVSTTSSRVSQISLLDSLGKASASVAETVTALVATPSEASHAKPAPNTPLSHSARFLRMFRDFRKGSSSNRTQFVNNINANNASWKISQALSAGRSKASAHASLLAVQAATDPAQLAEVTPLRLTRQNSSTYTESGTATLTMDDNASTFREETQRTPLVNPSNPRSSAGSSRDPLLFRWQHVFLARTNHHAVKWWSMTSPACLPLTTQYLPTDLELESDWEEYPYSVSVYADATSFLLQRNSSTPPALLILREMCAQRLSQGFQFVERQVMDLAAGKSSTTPSLHYSSRKNVSHPIMPTYRTRHPAELLRPGNFATGDPIYLSTTNQIHCLSYNRQAGMIHVKRYLKKTPYSTAPIDYKACIWPRYFHGYRAHAAKFVHPDPHAYNWTYLDSLIAGYEESFTEMIHYWRARFVLVPSEGSPPPMTASTGEKLSDEEVRLLGTDRLAELFARAEYLAPNTSRTERAATLRFLPTTLDASSSLLDSQFVQALHAMNKTLSERRTEPKRVYREVKSRSLDSLAAELVSHASDLQVNDRLWHRVLYRDTFIGADLVSYLYRTYHDIRTRDEAVQLGRELQTEKYVEHVLGVHGFMDGHYFYRFTDRARKHLESTSCPSPRDSHANRHLHSLRMSRSMLIDLDPSKKSDRAEVAVLHHDLSHNAENGFNFQIHWLGTTARLIEDTIQSWTRAVDRYGLRLIEAPIGQIKDVSLHHPFLAPVKIHLALTPPARNEYRPLVDRANLALSESEIGEPSNDFERWLYRHVLAGYATQVDQLFEIALLRHFGFVLDQEAASRYPKHLQLSYSSRPTHFDYSQFVHRSGIAFVQVRQVHDSCEGFLWLHNRLFTSHIHPAKSAAPGKPPSLPPDADELRRTFQRFCSDSVALDTFYRSVWTTLERIASYSPRTSERR